MPIHTEEMNWKDIQYTQLGRTWRKANRSCIAINLTSLAQKYLLYSAAHFAQVAKLVYALVLGTSGAIRGGSSPLLRTTLRKTSTAARFLVVRGGDMFSPFY